MLNEREWTYHAPTPETSPKYAAIRGAESALLGFVRRMRTQSEESLPSHDDINNATRRYAQLIDDLAPESADKSAAIRCCRLVRNALNEARVERLTNASEEVNPGRPGSSLDRLLGIAEAEVVKARWQANAAIALNP